MTKHEFVREVGIKSNTTHRDVKEILNAIRDVIVEHMKDEDGVTPFRGIKFYAVYKDARRRRNPSTGEMIDVSPNYSPRVKFTQYFKEIPYVTIIFDS